MGSGVGSGVTIGVGSGVVNDIAKILSNISGKPYIIVGTAPSMDGFASDTAPIIENNFKNSVKAEQPSIILADTKFEFGVIDGKVSLVDEVLTPDSSRFWLASEYQVGCSPVSLDKQYVRDYLEGLDWDKTPPAPALPEDVVAKTHEKYLEALKAITGRTF